MGINVLKFVIWGDKSSVLWSQISFYEISDNLNFPDDNFKDSTPQIQDPSWEKIISKYCKTPKNCCNYPKL